MSRSYLGPMTFSVREAYLFRNFRCCFTRTLPGRLVFGDSSELDSVDDSGDCESKNIGKRYITLIYSLA